MDDRLEEEGAVVQKTLLLCFRYLSFFVFLVRLMYFFPITHHIGFMFIPGMLLSLLEPNAEWNYRDLHMLVALSGFAHILVFLLTF